MQVNIASSAPPAARPAPAPPATAAPAAPESVPRPDAALAERHVETVRSFFDRLGVTPEEGNGPIELLWNARRLDTSAQRDDSIRFGRSTTTGTWHSDALDTVAHEYAHRVIDRISGTPWSRHAPAWAQTGQGSSAIESIADVFAAAVDDAKPWVQGEVHDPPHGLFNMQDPAAPGTLMRQATHMRELRRGEMQYNVGIPNRAAYLFGSRVGREAMARVYLDAIRHHINGPLDFESLANAVTAASRHLHGPDSDVAEAARQAWAAVGVPVARW